MTNPAANVINVVNAVPITGTWEENTEGIAATPVSESFVASANIPNPKFS